MGAVLQVQHLKKTFYLSKKQQKLLQTKEKVKVAVNDVSFDVYQGEIYGLLGPNGAGKTTVLRILSTLIKPDEGDALVEGISILKDPYAVRSKIGFLTSELKLEDFFTPNYLFDYFSHLHGLDKKEIEKRKETLFQQFGISDFREIKVADLSTGMKQKVSLVISIAHDPDIIIFDEPTNGLDVITAKTVTDFLLACKQAGKTILLSTHIFSLVEKLCDRVGIIIQGKMIVSDRLDNLTKETDLETLFFQLYEQEGGNQP